VFLGFFALRVSQRLAARASSDATGACSVSFNVAASPWKTVISRANSRLCIISGQASPGLVGRDCARDQMSTEKYPTAH
jgi:hypothetical protein